VCVDRFSLHASSAPDRYGFGVLGRIAREALDALPASAQQRLRSTKAGLDAWRAQRDLRPFIEKMNAGIDGFDGKRVIDVGADHGAVLLMAIDALYQPRELIGLNPAFPTRQVAPHISVQQLAAEHSGLEADSVDAVISSSAFEHVHDLPAVLTEMYRVLKPGGMLYSHFGPIWSTSYVTICG
jgi:SAM-dependent methyltransferase